MTPEKKATTDAVEILHNRYIQGHPEREIAVESAYLADEIAGMIYDLRHEAGLSQRDFAKLIGTTQSVISRLEDSDYEGHSLKMLERIAKALNKCLSVSIRETQVREDTVHYAFRQFLQNARRRKGLTAKQASKKLDIELSDLDRMESDSSYRPSSLTIKKLSRFYGVANDRLAALAGVFNDLPPGLKEKASIYAGQCEPFTKLSKDEKKALDEFMRYLQQQ
jgi:transcriptional regulator with XRE-family HTH domain